jgi:hypothetical protein
MPMSKEILLPWSRGCIPPFFIIHLLRGRMMKKRGFGWNCYISEAVMD